MVTRSRVLVLFLGVPLVIVAGFLLFLATKSLVGGDGAQEAVSTPSSSVPVTKPSNVRAGTSASGPPLMKCGEVATTDAFGNLLGALEPLVRGIHDAACHRDYSGLLPYMEDSFGGFPKEDVVAGWQRQDTDSALLRTLAETLETQAFADQGGQYFCHPSGAVTVFARGTIDRPGKWSDFDPTGHRLPGLCEVSR